MITDETTAGRRYHHNGDFSGNVLINFDVTEMQHIPGSAKEGDAWQAVVPMEDLIEIVASYARSAAIQTLEGADARAVLDLPDLPFDPGPR